MSTGRELRLRFRTSQQMAMVAQSWGLAGEDLGRYLRKNGISSSELKSWREQMKDGMDDGRPMDRLAKKKLNRRIEELEKELNTANGIIELQKKAQKIWEKDAVEKAQGKSEPSSSKQSKK